MSSAQHASRDRQTCQHERLLFGCECERQCLVIFIGAECRKCCDSVDPVATQQSQ